MSAEMTCPVRGEVSPCITIKYQYPNSSSFEFAKIELSPGLCIGIVEDCRKRA